MSAQCSPGSSSASPPSRQSLRLPPRRSPESVLSVASLEFETDLELGGSAVLDRLHSAGNYSAAGELRLSSTESVGAESGRQTVVAEWSVCLNQIDALVENTAETFRDTQLTSLDLW